MRSCGIQVLMVFLVTFSIKPHAIAATKETDHLAKRIEALLQTLVPEPSTAVIGKPAHAMLIGPGIRIEQCKNYPYHNQGSPVEGYMTLAKDIRDGLRTGLRGMAGLGPTGPVHPYHRQQAELLLDIIESSKQKTFRCVEDQTFAYAVAKPPPGLYQQSEQNQVIHDIAYPGVAIDTYRLSGFLTRKHEPSTYRDFFKLNDKQIAEHLGVKPKRMQRLHRYQNRKALVFHEVVHWLGHAHTNMAPDVVDLYEICFFAGSDFIDNPETNQKFQQRACTILRDKQLWESDEQQQASSWRVKGYDRLKPDMRKMYD